MSEIKLHIDQARRFEFGRVHHYRDAEALYEKDSASGDFAAVALGRLCMKKLQFSIMEKRTDTLARLRRAAATSEPSFMRKLALYIAYVNETWNSESINLFYLASEKNDCQAEYIMSNLLEHLGDVVMKYVSVPIADSNALYLDCLQRSARLGFLEASCSFGCYYLSVGQVEGGLRMLTRAAESGWFAAFERLRRLCQSVGSDVYYVDMEAFLSHAKRLACDENDITTAGYLADYFVDDELCTLVDRVAALRFHRKPFRWESTKHTYAIFGDRPWERREGVFWGIVLQLLRDDYLLSSEHRHFPIVRTSNHLPVN